MLSWPLRFDTPWLSVFGLGSALLGLAWLLVGRRPGIRRGRWALAAATLPGLCAAVTLAAGCEAWLWQPLLALVPVALALGLPVSTWLDRPDVERRLSQVLGLVLLLGGVALLGWRVARLQQAPPGPAGMGTVDLATALRASPPRSRAKKLARTDAGRPILLILPEQQGDEVAGRLAAARLLGQTNLERKAIQTEAGPPGGNGHGWVFAGGRFWLGAEQVEHILQDNGYQEVDRPAVGDVAIFRDDTGAAIHSGLVRHVGADRVVLVESKWGDLGRFVHRADEHPYGGQGAHYYRTRRGTHLLRGVD
jgi:hypothetical protein